jgi:hypothetical protein
MKVIQLSSEKLYVKDDDKLRNSLFTALIFLGISLIFFHLYTSYKDGSFQLISSSVLIGFVLFLLGSYGFISKETSDCSIDKSAGVVRVEYRSPIKSKKLDFEISQVISIELEEIASIYYYIYRVNFILSDRKSIPLTVYSTREKGMMRKLTNRVAEFLGIETRFSRSDEPLSPIPPF